MAEAFTNSKTSYDEVLKKICGEIGASDSGSYYDVNSGYTITRIDFISEDITDSGPNHSILNTNDDNTNELKIYNKNEKDVDIIYSAICNNLGIQKFKEFFHDFTVKVSLEMLESIEDEESFEKKKANILKSGKKFTMEYNDFRSQNFIFTVTSIIFIAIQTSIPPIKTKSLKTFEECVKSFSGYPKTSIEVDDSGLNYMSCVVLKLKSLFQPWNGILNVKIPFFKDNLIRKLQMLLLRNDIKHLYEIRNKFDNNENITNIVILPEDKWTTLLPPLVSFTVKNKIKNITKDVHDEFQKLINNNDKKQRFFLQIFQYKIILYGYAIIEVINDVVKSKNVLLKTRENVPYLQNACCNETKSSTLDYFIAENQILSTYIEQSKKIELVLLDYKYLSMAPLFYYDQDTRRQNKVNTLRVHAYKDNNFEAIIFYLRFDKNEPIPNKFSKLSFIKPDGYKPEMKLSDKIALLETKPIFSTKGLDSILKIVFEKNTKTSAEICDDTKIPSLSDIEEFQNYINLKVEGDEKEGLNYEIFKILYNNEDTITNIIQINSIMVEPILQFIYDNNSWGRKEAVNWKLNLINMSKWSSWNIYNEHDLSYKNTIVQFLKNIVFKISNTYPSMINNNIRETVPVSNRWQLSATHKKDIVTFEKKNLFDFLNQFNKNDDKMLLNLDTSELQEIIEFMNKIPIELDISEELFKYCWYSVFRIYINACISKTETGMEIDEKEFLKRKMSLYLSMFLQLETGNKKFIDLSNLEINKQTFKFRQIEKKQITDMFKNLTSDGRNSMTEMRKLNLGIWQENKIGLVKYNPKAYDKNNIQTDLDPIDEEENDEDDIAADEDDMGENEDGYDEGDGDGNANDDDDNND